MQNRTIKKTWLPEVTIAKGIGIALVVIGHCVPNVFRIKQFIYLFHMPLFFFLSGYCYQVESEEKLVEYILQKVRTLYVPFVICNGFALLFHQLFCTIGVYPKEDLFLSIGQFIRNFVKILLCIKMEDVVAPLWFLPVLMFVCVGYAILNNIVSKVKFNKIIVHFCVYVVYMSGFIAPRSGVFRAYVLFSLGLFSYDLGFLFRKYHICDRMSNWITVIFIAVLLVAAQFFDINMIQMRLGNPAAYALFSILGICVVVKFSSILTRYNIVFLYHMGENSSVILKWHYYVFLIITIIQKSIIIGTTVDGINSFVQYYSSNRYYRLCWFIGYAAFGIGIPLAVKRLVLKVNKQIK